MEEKEQYSSERTAAENRLLANGVICHVARKPFLIPSESTEIMVGEKKLFTHIWQLNFQWLRKISAAK